MINMNKTIFKALDIRGIYPTDVNEETIAKVGRALVHMLPEGEIVVAYDARHGSTELVKALETAMLEESTKFGKKNTVTNIGLATTPLFYFTVCDRKAVGGAMITASHNPKEYNGMKVVRAMGLMVSGTDILEAVISLTE
jgi:phosphomannomutase